MLSWALCMGMPQQLFLLQDGLTLPLVLLLVPTLVGRRGFSRCCVLLGLLSLARCHRNPRITHPPVPALLQCLSGMLASLWHFTAGLVASSVPSTSPQDPCMQEVTRGSR